VDIISRGVVWARNLEVEYPVDIYNAIEDARGEFSRTASDYRTALSEA